jgi:site-specific DNA-methyltransferase (adenine-specific)
MIGVDRILVGDAATTLRRLPAGCIDCVVTSPPYFQLRNYQHTGQLGLEEHVDGWVSELRSVMHQIRRVLTPTGTVWLNIGDSYSTSTTQGAQPTGLLLGPERLALLLMSDGWIIRNKIVWAKRNPMPSPARDRLAPTWEAVYLLVRQKGYYFDLDAIRVPPTTKPKRPGSKRGWSVPPTWRVTGSSNSGLDALSAEGRVGHRLGKNPGDVWSLSTASYRGPHHAVFPEALVERPILAGSPERRCSLCRSPWRRPTARTLGHLAVRAQLIPTCECGSRWEPGLVLDPFMGSGTTALVAQRLGRNWLGIEVNSTFADLAEQRIAAARENQRRAA